MSRQVQWKPILDPSDKNHQVKCVTKSQMSRLVNCGIQTCLEPNNLPQIMSKILRHNFMSNNKPTNNKKH